MTTQNQESGDFSGKALIAGMLQVLQGQLNHARQEVFGIDDQTYQAHVVLASAYAMRKTEGIDPEQCKASFDAVCQAAPGVMSKAVERLLQATYMVAAASAEPPNHYKAMPLMQLSWIVGMAVGQVRDVEVLAIEKKRVDHAVAGASGAKARLSKFTRFDDWVKTNHEKHKGTPMDKARAMNLVVPAEITRDLKDPERRIYDLLRGAISYK